MAEVRALTAFTDKETGVFHQTGDSFSVKAGRAKELAEKKAVVILDAPAKEPAKKTAKKTAKK